MLRRVKGEMEESGYTFSEPVCDEEQSSRECLSVQTAMFSSINTTSGELSSTVETVVIRSLSTVVAYTLKFSVSILHRHTCLLLVVPPCYTSILVAENCYNASDNGMSYAGQVSTTRSGATCQHWGEDFPESENYCRNPGHVGLSPWCFTDRAARQWQYCDLQECGHSKMLYDCDTASYFGTRTTVPSYG